jgi:hypothetical protein
MGRYVSNKSPQENLERAIGMLKKYKERESRIVRGLGNIVLALRADNVKKASLAIDSLMQTDMAEARAHTQDRDLAIKLAVQVLKTHPEADTRGTAACKALGSIRQLAPEAFEEETVAVEAEPT